MRLLAGIDWIDIATLSVSSVALVVLLGTLCVIAKSSYREQIEKSKTRMYETAKFLHEKAEKGEWGINNLGKGVFNITPSIKPSIRRTRWNVTTMLFTKEHVSNPVVVSSRESDIKKAAMSAVSIVYAVEDQKKEIGAEIYKQLDGTEIYKSISIELSETIWVRLDIIKKRWYRKKKLYACNS